MGANESKSKSNPLASLRVGDDREQIAQQLLQLFDTYDADKSGLLDKSETSKLFEDTYNYLSTITTIDKTSAFATWDKFLGSETGNIDRQTFSRIVQIIRNKGLVSQQDVVFVGAGPVGLWAAIQLKVLRPDCRIVMYERHAKYIRSHVLRLEKLTTFLAVPRDKRLQDLTDKLPDTVRTNDLEEVLINLATQLGIEIRIEKVLSLEHLNTLVGDAQVIVGADGSRSTVRQLFFGEVFKLQECLRCIVDLKYEVEGPTRKLDLSTQAYALLKVLPYLVEEHVGKAKDGISPVTIRFIIDEKLYDEHLKDASFANPYIFPRDTEKLGTLKEAVYMWLNARKDYLGEKRRPGSEKMTAVKLSVYQAESVYKKDEKGRSIYLVGDAAFGVPFFRALNNGLLISSKLAHCVADEFSHQLGQEVLKSSSEGFTPFSMLGDLYTATYNKTTNAIHDVHKWSTALGSSAKAYQQYFNAIAGVEVPRARMKSNALGVIKQGLSVANMLPSEIQVKTISPEVQAKWRTENPGFVELGIEETVAPKTPKKTEAKNLVITGGDLGEDWDNVQNL